MKARVAGLGALVAAMALAFLAVATLLPARGRDTTSNARLARVPALDQPALVDSTGPASLRETERLIRAFEARVRAKPTADDLQFLATLYLQRGRSTGDAGTYV